ncbi:hypothetical protein [uncultured Jatrophihabitans sp.]|uniref:hypothetical protein n=1 Tax=uncultured Jatrophihabitans sp. TaxID=1610747 RepID=UPI0035C956B8
MLTAPNGLPLPRILCASDTSSLGFTPGVVRTELRLQRWQTLTRGIYLTRPDPPSRADWIRAGSALAGPGAVVSGWDVLHAVGLGSSRPPIDEVLILCPAGRHRVRGGVRIRPSDRPLLPQRLGMAQLGTMSAAPIARAVADTALTYRTLAPVRALVTSAAQQGLCSVDDLLEELESGPRNDSAFLRRALEDVIAGAASISEAALAEIMTAARLPEFELNVPLIDERGVHVATADVLWRSLRAVLEVDSQRHHFYEPQWRNTMRRHNTLSRYGLTVTHYPPVDIRDRPDFVLDEVADWLAGRAAELALPWPPAARCSPNGMCVPSGPPAPYYLRTPTTLR